MSYFAVLSRDPRAIEVVRCHANLWVLRSPIGQRVFYFDVGLGLKGKECPDELALALPMGVNDGDFIDLLEKVKTNANLIFGEPATIRNQLLELGEQGEEVLELSGLQASRRNDLSGTDYSVWTLKPVTWSSERETYVRCRFRVSSLRRNWLPQESGTLVDLRVCDVRESGRVSNQSGLDARIVPIQTLNLFAIVPASLKCRACSPVPRHVRMLEGEAWSEYLQRTRRSLSKRKLAVYYWKGPSGSTPIDKRNPFRAFLDLTEERAGLGWRSYLTFALIVIVSARARDVLDYFLPLAAGITSAVLRWMAGLGVVGIVGTALAWKSEFGWVIGLRSQLNRVGRSIDDWWHQGS